MTFNIYQPHVTTKITQVFNKDVKSQINLNTTATMHKAIVHNREKDTQKSKIYRGDTVVPYYHYYTL